MPSSVIVGSYSNYIFRVLKNSIPGKEIMGRWFKRKEYMYTYGLFMLRFERKQQNSEKQLPLRKKKKEEEEEEELKKNCLLFSIVAASVSWFSCTVVVVKVTQSCPTLCNHMVYTAHGQNTGVGRLFLLQGIFPTQGSKPGLLHCRWILYQLSHNGNLIFSCMLLLLLSRFIVSDYVRPHRRQPTRLPHPWDSPGKNTGVGSHFLSNAWK